LELAWEIALAGMRVLWVDFQIWFMSTFGTSITSIFNALKVGWIESMAFIKESWARVSSFLSDVSSVGERAGLAIAENRIRGQMMRGEIAPDVGAMTISQLRERANEGGLGARLAEIEAERAAARANIANAPQENLAQDAINAQNELENLNRDAFYHAYSADAARSLEGLPDMGDLGQQLQGTSRSTFNRDVLFGFGGTPMQQLIDKTQAIVDHLEPILQSIDEGIIGIAAGQEVS
jgi:hypothetical protein